MRELARLAIPFLADVGAITLPKGEGVDARTEAAWSYRCPSSRCAWKLDTVDCAWWRERDRSCDDERDRRVVRPR
jgi:hypothetical protein